MPPISTVKSSAMFDDSSELPIRQRGLFLHDHFFQDSREHFQHAMDKVLHDWDEDRELTDRHRSKLTDWDEDIFSDRLKRYRTLRKDHKKTDSQAITEINEKHQFKIILDVREFMQGCLKTSVVGDQELLVEGSIEETTSGVQGKKTFEKKFKIPSEAIISETTSTLSSDGILTIISPKKVIERERKEYKNEASSNCQMRRNNKEAKNQRHSIFSDNFEDEFLPVSRRGNFFSDSSFKDAHQDYNRAVTDVLKRWNENSEDEHLSYRNLRSRALKEENQAITETEDHQIYKIVIDVHDFANDGEVSVKVVNDQYLEVEGCLDQDVETNKCKKTFKRKFTLPRNTDIKNISSLLSSDGVLTITAPKKKEQINVKETIIPVNLEKCLNKESLNKTELETNTSSLNKQNKTQDDAAKECTAEMKCNAESKLTEEIEKNTNNGDIIPVTVDGNDDNTKHQDIKCAQTNASTESGSNQVNIINMKMKGIEKENVSEASSSDKETTSEKCEENNSEKVSGNEYTIPVKIDVDEEVLKNDSNKKREINVEEKKHKQGPGLVSYEANINNEQDKTTLNKVPIVRRGPFFIDSFFDESHKQFEKAVQNVLQKSGFTSRKNDLEFYRSLRQRSNNEQNQANGCTEDDTSFKIVVDLQDFKSGDIKVKIHNAKELTVEGEQNEKQSYTLFKRQFCRKFIFPSHINSEAVTSAVSEEGVLTINAPKKIKENCEEAKSEESVKSILISHDSNNGLNSSNEKSCKSEERDASHSISDNQNNESINSIDKSKNNDAENAKALPITRRGSFFTDPFFKDTQMEFKNTIKDFIGKSGFISKDDDFGFYRSLLERSTTKDKQAEIITESDNIYQIVLDIQGFSAEEIQTKFLSSTDLVIEATTEKKEEGSSSTRNFRRCFVLPNSVDVDAVTTSLSSDGILTISAPKKILEEKKEDGSCSKEGRKHICLNNGWEDEKTHQSSSERDGVRSKTFSKSKSSYHHIT
ncbi:unnamed protein product, partial [Meganyctiphanes norvegica]